MNPGRVGHCRCGGFRRHAQLALRVLTHAKLKFPGLRCLDPGAFLKEIAA